MTWGQIISALEPRGFRFVESVIVPCRYVVGPNGEIYGPLTPDECAEKFLGETGGDDARG